MKRKRNGCFFIFKSPHERNPRQSRILDSTPWIPDPCTVELGFRILSLAGFRSPGFLDSTSILSRIKDSTSENVIT